MGGGGRQRAVQLDQLPHARRRARRPHEAGRLACSSGAPPAASAATPCSTCSTAAARRSASCRRPTRSTSCTASAARPSSTARPRTTASGRTRHTQDESEWRRFGKRIRELVGEDPDIVFEHPGRQTMGASIFAAKRGGTVVTCAATSGYMVEFDNRHFWMKLKRLIASHFANYAEAYAANRLIAQGRIQPLLSDVFPLDRGRRRRPQRSTATSTRASSACSASRPRRASASTTPSGGPRSARTRSRCSARRDAGGGQGPDGAVPSARRGRRRARPHAHSSAASCHPGDAAHRDRPRRHRRPRPGGGDRVLPRRLRRRGAPPRDRRVATASRRR